MKSMKWISVVVLACLLLLGAVSIVDAAVTVKLTNKWQTGVAAYGAPMTHATATITWDSSYPTNGESLVARDFGMHRLNVVMTYFWSTLYTSNWVYGDQKLEVIYYDYDEGSDNIKIELPNATNIRTVTCDAYVIGW